MSVKLLTEQHLEFLSLKGGYTGSSESMPVKIPHCWKSHVTAQLLNPPTFSQNIALAFTFACFIVVNNLISDHWVSWLKFYND